MTRKPDDVVGSPGEPAVAGGHQTGQQEAITRQEGGGISDRDRNAARKQAGGDSGRDPPAKGGASGGHADQKATDDPPGRKSAAGGMKAERDPKPIIPGRDG